GVPELLALPVVPDRSLADEICVTAAATGPMHDPQLANNDDEACAAVAVLALGGELVLEKTDGREVVELGDEYTYTITATNALVAEDLAAVSLVDTLPAGVAFVAASDGGTVGGQLPDGTGGTVTWPTVGL